MSSGNLFSIVTCLPQESVLLAKDIGAVLMKMSANDTEKPVERTLRVVGEERECGLEVCELIREPSSKRRVEACVMRSHSAL